MDVKNRSYDRSIQYSLFCILVLHGSATFKTLSDLTEAGINKPFDKGLNLTVSRTNFSNKLLLHTVCPIIN